MDTEIEIRTELSKTAILADKVWRYLVFSGKFDHYKASELREKYITPIFGEEISKEIFLYYINQ